MAESLLQSSRMISFSRFRAVRASSRLFSSVLSRFSNPLQLENSISVLFFRGPEMRFMTFISKAISYTLK